MDAEAALAQLTEVSNQVETVVIFDPDGSALASSLDDARARRIAEAAARILAEAGAGAVQVEAATKEGSVVVVREGDRAIAATTTPSPVIGLVLYDLRTCLRSLEQVPK